MKLIKQIFIASSLIICSANAGAQNKTPLAGQWIANSLSPGATFSILFHQSGKNITGQYCAVARNGGKIDCNDEDTPNIQGTFDGKTGEINIRFSSFFDGIDGRAVAKVSEGKMVWRVKKWPVGGPSYAPKNAILRKESP